MAVDEELERALDEWQRASCAVAAAALEATAARAARALRGEQERPGELPAEAEEGDRLSGEMRELAIRAGALTPRDGIHEQEGMTEEEHERAHRG